MIHVKKICDIIAPLESKSIQILIEEDKILENFFELKITEPFLESYKKVYNDLCQLKDKDTNEVLDDDEEEPPTNYGDQSYDQRTCIYVLNRETLEREYNMTQMNFFNSNFFNVKPNELNTVSKGKSTSELKKKGPEEIFDSENKDSICGGGTNGNMSMSNAMGVNFCP